MSDINLPQPKERNLYLAKQVDQVSINEISKAIIEINEHDEYVTKIYAAHDLEYVPKPIKLYIDSYGGYVYQCFGLLGIMRNSKIPIHTIVTGCAMSCGFLISIAGHKRFGYPKSTYLYHQVSSGAVGKAKDMEEEVIETLRLQKMLEEHTLEYTRISAKKLEKVYKGKRDWFIDTNEALKLKIIDEVIS
jgi:ATP-dependent Clp protease protease subunit